MMDVHCAIQTFLRTPAFTIVATLIPEPDGAYFIAATPGYFTALRTPVLDGREFDIRDVAGLCSSG